MPALPTARVVRFAAAGGPEVIGFSDRALRAPRAGELLVDVVACGVNRADVLQRRGLYPAPPDAPPDVPGLEYAGTVVQAGAGAGGWRAGDRVMGLVSGGGMATRLLVPADEALPVPACLSPEQAAAVPEAFVTAWDALVRQGGLRAGQVALVHAAGSGVGTAAVQLAADAGACVAGTSRSADKLERCRPLGLRVPLPVTRSTREAPARFADALLAATGGRGADVILDLVGAAYLDENLRALAPRGRLVVLGLLGGAEAALPLARLMERRARITGSTLRTRPADERMALLAAFAAQVLPRFDAGRLRPVLGALLPMSAVAEAHALLERNETFGKVVLRW